MATVPPHSTTVDYSTISDTPSPETVESPDYWVEQYGNLLFRTALARVDDRQVAEDLVQEALLAAWRARGNFAGRSQRSTWLVGILKRKIADHFRRVGRSREVSPEDISVDLFDDRGLWRASVGELSFEMESTAEREEFWQSLRQCVANLPAALAQAFSLRELESKTPEQAAEHLGISRKNLAVRLHRARLLLRNCLEGRWLGERENST